MFKKLRLWLFPTTVDGFKFDAVDNDRDGIVQEGTPFERKLVSSMAKAKKKTPAKKTPAKKAAKKKAPVKKITAKKPATKKPVKKTTKKKK
jgi:hypothetical protein